MEMSNNPVTNEVLSKEFLRSILDISVKIKHGLTLSSLPAFVCSVMASSVQLQLALGAPKTKIYRAMFQHVELSSLKRGVEQLQLSHDILSHFSNTAISRKVVGKKNIKVHATRPKGCLVIHWNFAYWPKGNL